MRLEQFISSVREELARQGCPLDWQPANQTIAAYHGRLSVEKTILNFARNVSLYKEHQKAQGVS